MTPGDWVPENKGIAPDIEVDRTLPRPGRGGIRNSSKQSRIFVGETKKTSPGKVQTACLFSISRYFKPKVKKSCGHRINGSVPVTPSVPSAGSATKMS